MTSLRFCKVCEKKIFGRADKKYCSDYCRSTDHNRRNSEDSVVKKIHRILQTNRKILKKSIQNEETTINSDMLELEGFRRRYFTHQSLKGRITLYFCYDIAYYFTKNNDLVIH